LIPTEAGLFATARTSHQFAAFLGQSTGEEPGGSVGRRPRGKAVGPGGWVSVSVCAMQRNGRAVGQLPAGSRSLRDHLVDDPFERGQGLPFPFLNPLPDAVKGLAHLGRGTRALLGEVLLCKVGEVEQVPLDQGALPADFHL
jgi:hypothetical protein